MKNLKSGITLCTAYFFVLLFSYAAASKMLDFENFQIQLAQSPILSAYAGFASYGVIGIELAATALLSFRSSRRWGLYMSFSLMMAFTIYIALILTYADFIPCSCGGILSHMGWTEHLIFNITALISAGMAVILELTNQDNRVMMRLTDGNGLPNEDGRNKNRRAIIFRGVMLVMIPAVGMLTLFLSSEYIMKKENNFTRRFLLHPLLDEERTMDLGFNSYYFAGFDRDHIYLGNSMAPFVFTIVDADLKSKMQLIISADHPITSLGNVQIKVKAPYFYMLDGDAPVIYRGRLGAKVVRRISWNDAFFSQAAVLDSSTFAVRTMNTVDNSLTLGTLDLTAHPKVRLHPGIIRRQSDGRFDSDGKLLEDPVNGNLIYTYFYRNQFLVMNSSLGLLRRLKTIDTVGRAQIREVTMSDGTHKMGAPPLRVNKDMTVFGGILFNRSGLRGKFEERKAWNQASVIDCYRTAHQNYIGSFYIAKRGRNTVSHLLAIDGYLYTISGNELIRYRFAQPFIRQLKTGDAENL